MTRVLVTGGGGFVGRALVPVLLDNGYDVTVSSRGGDIGGLPPEVRVVATGPVGPDTDWSRAVADADMVVHLAGRVHVMRDDTADPLAEFRRVNVDGTRNLAEQAARAGVRRFVFVSSIKVNGERTPPDGAFTEAMAPAPEDPYGISKAEAEQALMDVAGRTALEPVVLRPPLVYGPGVKGNFLSLLKAAETGVPLPIGCATNIRSLVYVGNLVDAIRVCLTDRSAPGQVFLIRDTEDISVGALYRRIGRALGRSVWTVPVPRAFLRVLGWVTGRSTAVGRLLDSLRLDDRHLRNTLAWRPPYSLDKGLAATGSWFRDQRR